MRIFTLLENNCNSQALVADVVIECYTTSFNSFVWSAISWQLTLDVDL